ncbi:carboxymuconolactone decarboxylase family protein [Candidatus Riflebacteria bacterium]
MRMLAEFFPEFTAKMNDMDELWKQESSIDEKTYQLICFALAIKSRAGSNVQKHFSGAIEAGSTVRELNYILALVMREAAAADDSWAHEVIGEWRELLSGEIKCRCEDGECE